MKARNVYRILVTGGAGFIGSHTVDLLVNHGYEVTILDNLEPQVYGKKKKVPDYVNKKANFVQGDIRNYALLKKVMKDVDAVVHLAAIVGVGQSMYQIEKYIDINTRGTANLLDALVDDRYNVKKLVVASSMSVYGEGRYHCEKCDIDVYPELRSEEQLRKKLWDHVCPTCGSALNPIPTDEDKPLMPTSIYAMSKRHQEEMCLLTGKIYGIPTVALRYFNVYGSRQSLSNPYTGACAIFSSRILNNNPPYVFEDGKQTRDFIHVRDAATATLKAVERSGADYKAVNVGTGEPMTIKELAEVLTELYGSNLKPYISNEYRKGDIRHCYADTRRERELLGFKPSIELKQGLMELTEWAKLHSWESVDLFEKSLKELTKMRLIT